MGRAAEQAFMALLVGALIVIAASWLASAVSGAMQNAADGLLIEQEIG